MGFFWVFFQYLRKVTTEIPLKKRLNCVHLVDDESRLLCKVIEEPEVLAFVSNDVPETCTLKS